MRAVTKQHFLNVWAEGLESSSAIADDFLSTWSKSGLIQYLEAFVNRDDQIFLGRKISATEKKRFFDEISEHLEEELPKSGRHRKGAWESGWADNLAMLSEANVKGALIPGYFEKSKFIRLGDDIFEVSSPQDEPNALGLLVDIVVGGVFKKYGFGEIHEFGCGTGIHVSRLGKQFPTLPVTGYDWASTSVEIIDFLSERTGQLNLAGKVFDFYEPDFDVVVGESSLVLTVAALEQVGEDFRPFMNFLQYNRPGLVVNIEPMAELLDLQSHAGQLSASYFERRNYLKGFYSALEEMHHTGVVEILHSGRSGIGSQFIEGYSVVIWRYLP